jgi:hypothetical protein
MILNVGKSLFLEGSHSTPLYLLNTYVILVLRLDLGIPEAVRSRPQVLGTKSKELQVS